MVNSEQTGQDAGTPDTSSSTPETEEQGKLTIIDIRTDNERISDFLSQRKHGIKPSHLMHEGIPHSELPPDQETAANTGILQLAQSYLDDTAAAVTKGRHLLDVLRLLPNDAAPQMLAELFRDIGTGAETAAKDVCITAIQHQIMTRKKAAEIFGVHQMTVGRWVTARTVDQPPEQ